MKKLTFLALCLIAALITTAQPAIGWNMVNATKSILTLSDSTWLLEQIPVNGTLSWRDRYDKGDENPQDIININNWLEARDRHLSVIFCAGDEPELDNIGALQSLINAGVNVVAIEYVNEAFYPAGGYSFDWSKYEANLVPFLDECKLNFPGIPVSIPLAPRSKIAYPAIGSNSHNSWNAGAFAFEDAHPEYDLAYSIHLYYTGDFVPVLGAANTEEVVYGAASTGTYPVKRVYDYKTDLTDDTYFQRLVTEADPYELWNPAIEYIRQNTSAPLLVTEAGYVGTGELNGSYGYAAGMWKVLTEFGKDERIQSINLHAGISRSRAGACGPRKPFDHRDKDNPNNVSTPTWDAVTLYLQMGEYEAYTGTNALDRVGTYRFAFRNDGSAFTPVFLPAAGYQVNTVNVYSISAARWGSIATSMDFTKPGSVLGENEVTGITQGATVNALSFGYVEVVVAQSPKPTCGKRWWQFWKKCKE